MFDTPVLFLIFNRPDVTFQVFERIKQAKPKFLYIAADGPRKEKAGELELCVEARSIIQQIDWDCELKTLFRDENVGCGRAVSEAITWFFENEEKGIILEDDCLPDLSFFTYCKKLLEYYKDEERVMHIGGTNSQFGRKNNGYSYYFSKYPHIWGWATWRRAWSNYTYNLKNIPLAQATQKIFKQYNFSTEEARYWERYFDLAANRGIDTWDIQWTFTIWYKNGITIVPNTNLISNIGFNANATHTTSEVSMLANVPTGQIAAISHPKALTLDAKADNYTFQKYNLAKPPTYITIKNWASRYFPRFLKEEIKKRIK